MLSRILTILLCICWFSSSVIAQVFNNGERIVILSSSQMFVPGDFINQKGTALLNGTLTVNGNWVNNDPVGNVFDVNSSGQVNFSGAGQTVSGSQITGFPNLALSGNGVKRFTTSSSISGVLNLQNNELALQSANMFILSANEQAILFNSGFISTDKQSRLFRTTDKVKNYIYPLGQAAGNLVQFKPVVITPKDDLPNIFGATLNYRDPGTDGFNRDAKRADVNQINKLYYHIVEQLSGASLANVDFHFNFPADGDFNQLALWSEKSNVWEKAAPSNSSPGNLFATLNRMMTYTSTGKFNATAFALANSQTANDPLTFFNSFTPDGDGKNDRWAIKNIDLFPDNELVVFNRWGAEVFKSNNYTSAKAWDGSGLNNGTYYYVLKVQINNEPRVYKGFITLLKK